MTEEKLRPAEEEQFNKILIAGLPASQTLPGFHA